MVRLSSKSKQIAVAAADKLSFVQGQQQHLSYSL